VAIPDVVVVEICLKRYQCISNFSLVDRLLTLVSLLRCDVVSVQDLVVVVVPPLPCHLIFSFSAPQYILTTVAWRRAADQ